MRAFLALELPDAARAVAAQIQQQLRVTGTAAAWVRTENFHLTLRFLGDVQEPGLMRCAEVLRESLAGCGAVRLQVFGAGAFPSTRKPSVLWAGVRVQEGNLGAIYKVCEATARSIGLAPETRAFHPHVTLGRVRDPRRAAGLQEAVPACATLSSDEFTVTGVALFKSTLSAGGSIYHPLENFSLL